jgi:trehalose 6-phosphate phosphatase
VAARHIADAAHRTAEIIAHTTGFHALRGKDVTEIRALAVTKGDAIARLIDGTDMALYAGDDVTDEDAFAALRPTDLSIHVGEGFSRAQYRIDTPASLSTLLRKFATLRATHQ